MWVLSLNVSLPVLNSCHQGRLRVSTSESHGGVCELGGRAASPGKGCRAPENQVGVGGFGRIHRQLGPGNVLPLPAPNGPGKVPPSDAPLHQAAAGRWGGKALKLGQLPTGISRVKAVYHAEDRLRSSTVET